jgi:formate dehydrogenase alpha subunit
VAGLATTLGSGAMTNPMDDVSKADVVLLVGANATQNHPVFASLLKRAVKHGKAKLIVADPRRIDLCRFATIHLQHRPGTDVALLGGLQHIILREGWFDRAYVEERTEGFLAWSKSLELFTPERSEELCGVPKQSLYEAARLYARGGRGALYYCMGVTQHTCGIDNVKAVANLQLITGNVGVEGGGVNPLRGQNNVQGACDMGALPNVLTGYQLVTDARVRQRFEAAWKVAGLSGKVGLTLTEMIPASGDGIRALYIMGENPMVSDPDLTHVEQSLRKLDLLVVQDIFLTETARLAHVVLPAASFAEKLGTYTNTERRVQLSSPALAVRGQARPDHAIIADLALRFGQAFPRTPEALYDEMRELTPSYRGIRYDRIREVGIQWPCPHDDHPGTPILHVGRFARGSALLSPLTWKPPAEPVTEDWPMTLSTGRILEHYHTRSMTGRSQVLQALVKSGHVEINPVDAERLGVVDGALVRVTTRRGSIETRARLVTSVSTGTIFIPFHFAEAAANVLTQTAMDPVAKIPEYKVCAARIEAVTGGVGERGGTS